MKKAVIILILCCLIFTGCTTKNNEEKIDISSDRYFKILESIFTEATKDNEFLYYSGYTRHYPYIQVAIKPRKQMSKSVMENQSKIIETNILSELKKYDYKSGNIFRYGYEYINIYFYDYTDNGQLNRNGGPFLQIEILEI